MTRGLLVFLFTALLSACGTNPMTPAEFRTSVKGGAMLSTAETYQVNRPFPQVAETLKKKANECLRYSLTSVQKPTIGVGSTSHTYAYAKPTVLISSTKASLYFQVKLENVVGGQPKDGNYYFVADAYPIGPGKTRVETYRMRVELLAKAVKGWASGENMGCPDQTKIL